MTIAYNPATTDVQDSGYTSGEVTVGTTEVEAKVGGSILAGRETLYLENKGSTTIFYGPTGLSTSSGARLDKKQFVFLKPGTQSIFLIGDAASGTVLVQEMS